jgi:hypothetical protein
MKRTDIAFLACRVLAIYIFFRALQHLSHITLFIPRYDDPEVRVQTFFYFFAPFLVLVCFGVVLWIFAGRTVQYIFPMTEEGVEQVTMINTKEIYALAFSIAGIILLAVAIPGIFQVISSIVVLNTHYDSLGPHPVMKIQTTFAFMEKIAQLVIAFCLIFGSRGLSELLSKIRGF